MNKIFKILTIILLALTATSCKVVSLRNFELKKAEVVRFDMSGAEVVMTIRNKSLFKVTLVDGVLGAYDEGKLIGEELYCRLQTQAFRKRQPIRGLSQQKT